MIAKPSRGDTTRGDVLGLRSLAKNAHESKVVSHAESDYVVPIPMFQDHVRHSRAQLTTHINLTLDPNI